MKRFPLLILALLVLVALWVGFWLHVSGLIADEAARLAEADGVTAPRVTCEHFTVSGFPFHFSPICTGARIESGDVTVTLAQVSGTALFYRPNHMQIFFDSPARISDAFTGSAHELAWNHLRASLRLDGNRLARFSMIGDDLVHADALFGSMVLGTTDHLEFHLVDATPRDAPATSGQTLDVFARIDGTSAQGFEIANGTASVDGRLTGVPPLDLLGHPDRFLLWHMAGGTLILRKLDASADGIALTAGGEASLDDQGRVNATLELASRGLVERFPGLAEDPVAALFLGAPDADGAYRQTLSVRGGTLFVGMLPVLSLAPLF